jgi:hypothetical protein
MIDTDKYKGHTPAPWLNHNPDDPLAHRHDQCDFMVGTYQKSKNGSMYFKLVADWGGCVNCLPDANSVIAEYPDWANARLIADAPLLLAEVKRLQKRSKKLENALLTLADGAGDVPMFNKGGEAYEALWGEEE